MTSRIWRSDDQEKRNFHVATDEVVEKCGGVLPLRRDKENEVLQGPFKEMLLETMKGGYFSVTISRALKWRELRVVHGPLQKMEVWEKAARSSEVVVEEFALFVRI